ncbi:MAG: hypothetical protein HXX14_19455 [Bacteroidetes bacterium]|nr:hypothetical protein [Bacteroidota bacterium]
MNTKSLVTLIVFLLFKTQIYSITPTDTLKDLHQKPVRVYHTSRLTTGKPVIDGVLNDACWKTGEWASNFTQWVPNEGGKPSQPTELKVLYDDKNIYVAIRAIDHEPKKISQKAGRRDELAGDIAGITFDSYHDHRTGFEFDLTAGGQKIDMVLTNNSFDVNWNAVWKGKVGKTDSAWIAEFEIPLSQLRYSSNYEQVWGMHCWRWIDRLQEESDWELQSSKSPGILYMFGELQDIKGLPKSRRIEIMPYTLGKLNTFKKEPENPFANKGRSWFGNAGIDAKIGLSSNFTADVTVNPDFGQVESDPSVMNLSAFETFYGEKRPFFLEGANIFSFDMGDASLFYSRRIGHAPSYYPSLKNNEHMDFPDNTTILSAVKISGKSSNGLSVGVLQSLTANEHAKIDSLGKRSKESVDPLTSYTIVRVQQDFRQGNTMLGGILTSTNRFIDNANLNFLNRDAVTGGLDLLHQWNDKEFYIDVKLVGSNIKGNTAALKELQYSSARYYQRPDAENIHYDSTRTQLSGYGGRIKIGKGSKGLWRYSSEFNWRSPGLDFNDIGYMSTSDIFKQTSSLSYFIVKPVSIFRTYNIGISQINNWDFGMHHLSSGGNLNINLGFLNKWTINNSLNYTSQALDTRILRGGYAMLVPSLWVNSFSVGTDPSKKTTFSLNTYVSASGNQSSRYYSVEPGVSIMPLNTLKFSMSVNYSSNKDNLQYVDTKSVGNENRYILGKIDQHTLSATFRIDYNITPELSIQYYGSPFASVGKYSDFKVVTNPRDANYQNRFSLLSPVMNNSTYNVSENGSSHITYSFSNPDFNFDQFRSNFVFRWEYRPGSQIYFAWSQDRTEYITPGYNSVSDAIGNIKNIFPKSVFLIKLNYWFSI